jgi:ribosomal protein L29
MIKKVKKLNGPMELKDMSREDLYKYIDTLHSVLMNYQDIVEYSEGKSKKYTY